MGESNIEERMKKYEEAQRKSRLIGIIIDENDKAEIVITPEDYCTTEQDIKDVMVEKNIIGSVIIAKDTPIRRVVQEVIKFG